MRTKYLALIFSGLFLCLATGVVSAAENSGVSSVFAHQKNKTLFYDGVNAALFFEAAARYERNPEISVLEARLGAQVFRTETVAGSLGLLGGGFDGGHTDNIASKLTYQGPQLELVLFPASILYGTYAYSDAFGHQKAQKKDDEGLVEFRKFRKKEHRITGYYKFQDGAHIGLGLARQGVESYNYALPSGDEAGLGALSSVAKRNTTWNAVLSIRLTTM